MTVWLAVNLKPYSGRYEWPESEFTTRELGWIKRLAGYLPAQLDDAAAGDPELLCVLAVIAMYRAGRIQAGEVPGVYERLLDVPVDGALKAEGEAVEAPEGEPDPTRSERDSDAPTSGNGSPTSSALSASDRPRLTGMPGSATSVFAPPMSET